MINLWINLWIWCELVVYTFLKLFKKYFLQTRCSHVKYLCFHMVNRLFHIFRKRYFYQYKIKKTPKILFSVEKFFLLHIKRVLWPWVPIKYILFVFKDFSFKKYVDKLWIFLCMAADCFRSPQKGAFYQHPNPQFVHMIKCIDYKWLCVL